MFVYAVSFGHLKEKRSVWRIFTFLEYLVKSDNRKPFECNAVYVPMITLDHAMSHDFNDVKINHSPIQSD